MQKGTKHTDESRARIRDTKVLRLKRERAALKVARAMCKGKFSEAKDLVKRFSSLFEESQ